MKELKIDGVRLFNNSAEKFEWIKAHMEATSGEEQTNEYVAQRLIEMGMNVYKFV